MRPFTLVTFLWATRTATAINFPYESIQLLRSEIGNDSDIFFGNGPSTDQPPCKSYPGHEAWPSDDRWNAFNLSLGGTLIKGIPPTAACYEGEYKDTARCNVVRRAANNALWA